MKNLEFLEKDNVSLTGELFKISKETDEANFRRIEIHRETPNENYSNEVINIEFRKAPANEDCFLQFSITRKKFIDNELIGEDFINYSIPKEFSDLFLSTFIEPSKNKFTVSYYMKGKSKESKSFNTFPEAQSFMNGLNENPECESFRHERVS